MAKLLQTILSGVLISVVVISEARAQDPVLCDHATDTEYKVTQIRVVPNPIFDETAQDTIPLHRWANSLHTITKPLVIRERLTFDPGDSVSEEDLIEAEAILRAQRYLANAEISTVADCQNKTIDVTVTTYDNWSLIPTLSFSRRGGENNTLIGVRDDNLFGLGIRATARYTEDEQRSGYQFSFNSLVPGVRHANLGLRLEDNDDGEVYSIVFDKPFYHLNTSNSVFARAFSAKQTEDIFQNDETRNSFAVDSRGVTASYGWALSASNIVTHRLMLGMTLEKTDFMVAQESPSADLTLLPEDRDFLYPWLQFELAERNIVVMEDVYLINQPEDINLGWQLRTRIGIELDNDENRAGFHSNLAVSKGFLIENSLLMINAELTAVSNAGVSELLRLDAGAEYFYRHSDLLGYYTRLNTSLSKGQFLDQPIVIDDENGVRGFPFQYQHGDHRVSASAEVRFYTDYSIYQLFEVGFAGFMDVGRAFDGIGADLNEDPGWLSSLGIGLRLYSNKASATGVVHIDIAKPFSEGDSLNNWEWSARLRRAF